MTTLIDIIEPGGVLLDVESEGGVDHVVQQLIESLTPRKEIKDINKLYEETYVQSGQKIPLLEGGVLLPHARTEAVTGMVLSAARLKEKLTVEGPKGRDEEAEFVFYLAGPPNAAKEYLRLAGSLARILRRKQALQELREVEEPADFIAVLDRFENQL